MAITITQAPESYASLHDDLWHVVTSNNTSQSNFKYVVDVYVASSLVARLKLFPDPNEDCGAVNVANIVRNYWSSYFRPPTTQTAFAYEGNDIYVDYELKFGEEYGGTTYLNLTTATYKAYNFAQPIFRDWSTSYLATFENKWLTNRDKSGLTVGLTERLFVPYLVGTPPASIALKVSADGAAQVTGSGVSCDTLAVLDLSPVAINTYLSQSLITASTKVYTVQIGSGDILTIRPSCSKFTPIVVHFLGALGGYETMRFALVNRRTSTAERRTFERPGWNLGADVMNRYDAYKVMAAGSQTFAVDESVDFTLNSDMVSATDYNWLRELVMSPEIYLEQNGYFYPVTVKDTNWVEKIRNSDKTFNFSITLTYGRNLNSQYR